MNQGKRPDQICFSERLAICSAVVYGIIIIIATIYNLL